MAKRNRTSKTPWGSRASAPPATGRIEPAHVHSNLACCSTGKRLRFNSSPHHQSKRACYSTGKRLRFSSSPHHQSKRVCCSTGKPLRFSPLPQHQSKRVCCSTGKQLRFSSLPQHQSKRACSITGMVRFNSSTSPSSICASTVARPALWQASTRPQGSITML